MPLRPRGFEPVEACDEVWLKPGPEVMMVDDPQDGGSGVVAIREPDRVVVGGGLPDEAIEADPGDDHHMTFEAVDGGKVDVCRKEVDGEEVFWLAP